MFFNLIIRYFSCTYVIYVKDIRYNFSYVKAISIYLKRIA